MCGIVGIHLRDPSLEPELGDLASQMLEAMTDRGPDSSGIAIYSGTNTGNKITLSALPQYDWTSFGTRLTEALDTEANLRITGPGAVVSADVTSTELLNAVTQADSRLAIMSRGQALEVFKDVGSPREICDRYDIPSRSGYQAVGHTRMATESAVTTEHSHPFSPDDDLCLVHNGAFSNYFSVRRDLEDDGVEFITDNDSEVAARWIAREIACGADLGEALRSMMQVLDGFYTLLIATRTEFAVVRDAFACKPAVIAETDRYVAMASEYRALAELPGIEGADVYEPAPEDVYSWSR